MAFKKSDEQKIDLRKFKSFDEARGIYEDSSKPQDERLMALDYILRHKELYYALDSILRLFANNKLENHVFVDYLFTNLGLQPKRADDFDKLFEMLKSDDAYVRNAVIKYIQNYGSEVAPYIKTLLDSNDRDVRIFAINILGDVKFEDSLNLLRYFIAKERDINALMTAVDYIREIGEESDIALLEALKSDYKDEAYVQFGINMAINRIKGLV